MRHLLVMTALFVGCVVLFAQNQPAKRAADQAPTLGARRATVEVAAPTPKPPKLALEEALEIAKTYATNQKIDLATFWLYRVAFTMYGNTGKNALPAWHVWWVNNDGAFGNYVEIIVTMDGKCTRAGSL
jgi:hypothetical protein